MARKTPKPTREVAFDAAAWVRTSPARRIRAGGQCSICANEQARKAVRDIVELWIQGAHLNFTRIAEEVLIGHFGFGAPTGQTVSRHLRRDEPDLWAKLEAARQT